MCSRNVSSYWVTDGNDDEGGDEGGVCFRARRRRSSSRRTIGVTANACGDVVLNITPSSGTVWDTHHVHHMSQEKRAKHNQTRA